MGVDMDTARVIEHKAIKIESVQNGLVIIIVGKNKCAFKSNKNRKSNYSPIDDDRPTASDEFNQFDTHPHRFIHLLLSMLTKYQVGGNN